MRTVNIHARSFGFKTTKKAIKRPPDPPLEYATENALVVFTCIERGDDEQTLKKAVNDIVRHAETVKAGEIIIYPYAHLSNNLEEPDKASKLLDRMLEMLKERKWKTIKAPFGWYKEFTLQAMGHPLAELSRTFNPEERTEWRLTLRKNHEKIIEYLKRFGLILSGEAIRLEWPWKTLSCQACGETQGKICYTWKPEEALEANCKICIPLVISADGREYVLPDTLEKNKNIKQKLFRQLETKEDTYIKVRGKSLEGVIGVRKGDEEWLLKNALIIALIADRLESLEKGETPTLPLSLSPIQAVIINPGGASSKYVVKIEEKLRKNSIERLKILTGERLGNAIRWAGQRWVPLVIIAGRREEETGTLVIRTRQDNMQRIVGLEEIGKFLEKYS